MTDPFVSLQNYRAQIVQTQENSARLAQHYANYQTAGWGEFTDPHVIHFDATFYDEPWVSYGYSIDGDTLIDTRFPRACGFVYRWKQDERGYFLGCWLAFTVDTQSPFIPSTVPDPGYTLIHKFVFTGRALKDIDPSLADF
jgi:hypothetical protein